METLIAKNGDVDLFVRVEGEGPTLIMLHGWPDTGTMWRELNPLLVAAGYRVVTPDLRGCGQSSKPKEVEKYRLNELVADVACIADAVGADTFTVIGHDWGAALAWAVALFLPDRVEKNIVLAVGHPVAFRNGGIKQQQKSWYMLVFINEDLGTQFLRHNNYEAMTSFLDHPWPEETIAELERDGQIVSHFNWYKANITADGFMREPLVLPPIQAPSLGMWSANDWALLEEQMETSGEFCANGFTYVRLSESGHWSAVTAPNEVAGHILNFLAK